MYDVSTNEYHDEFVEIYNLSTSNSVDIRGWIFSDSSGTDEIVSVAGDYKLAPLAYAVILDGSYFKNSTVYDSVIPDSVLILSISDNSFGKNGLSNSRAERLTITDSTGQILTSYRYTTGNLPGYSDEKIELTAANTADNWQDCKVEGGTPGRKNSVSPPQVDIGFGQNSLSFPDLIFEGDSLQLLVNITNFGTTIPMDSVALIVFSDRNQDSLYNSCDIKIADLFVPDIAQMVVFTWKDIPAGRHQIEAIMSLPNDENQNNNQLSRTINVICRKRNLHINEIKFLTNAAQSEWIELINGGSDEIYLKGWAITDRSDTAVINQPYILSAKDYVILSADTLSDFYGLDAEKILILPRFPVLNDNGDYLQLIEPAGNWQETIHYDKNWLEGEDIYLPSLERIHPSLYSNKAENWGPCVDDLRATPARMNSIYADIKESVFTVHVCPNPFSPDNDGREDATIISGSLSLKSARIRAKIFDIRGRLIRTLRENAFTGSRFQLVWDGKDEQKRVARIGIYLIYIQILNDRQGIISELKTSVVLAHTL